MNLDQFASKIKVIYGLLEDSTFQAECVDRDTAKVLTGGPRDVLLIEDAHTCSIMEQIVDAIGDLEAQFDSHDPDEKVWKGITLYNEHKLWVHSYVGPDSGRFRVTNIEVKTGLNWQKPYKALVNITVVPIN